MSDILKAKGCLCGETRCAVIKGENIFVSEKRGISSLLEMLSSETDFSGGVAADKIVGKAAAFIYVKAQISELYAEVLSKAAISVLEKYGIKYSYSVLTDGIRNRKGDGPCPMENAVKDILDPDQAVEKLKETVMALRQGK